MKEDREQSPEEHLQYLETYSQNYIRKVGIQLFSGLNQILLVGYYSLTTRGLTE